jgi:type I restriction enzyme S subunit
MEKVQLGTLVKITSGFAFKSNLFNTDKNGLPLIRIRDVVRGYSDTYYDGEYKTEYLIQDDDALIGMDGEFNLALWKGSKALLNQRVCKIQSIDERLDQNYLIRFLPKALKDIEDKTPFVTVKHLSVKDINNIQIPLPPLEEQRRIASILDQADELRQKRQQAIEKLDQLLQATFIDMFGDPVSNPKGFEVKKLSEQVDLIQIGPFGTQLHQEDYIENGIPLINPSHIKNGKIIPNHKLTVSQSKYEELTQYHLRLNDVLLGRRGEMGRCAVVTQNEVGWLCGTGSLFLRPNLEKINPFFLELLLSSDSIKRYLENVSQGQTMANLNKTIVGTIPLISPSIEIQNKFFLIAEKIDKMKTELKSAKNQVNNLFESLQNQAFNGTL